MDGARVSFCPTYLTNSYVFDTVASCYESGNLLTWHNPIDNNFVIQRLWGKKSDINIAGLVDLALRSNSRNLVSANRILFILVNAIDDTVDTEGYIYDSTGKLLEHRKY
jgi:hypothetical protein